MLAIGYWLITILFALGGGYGAYTSDPARRVWLGGGHLLLTVLLVLIGLKLYPVAL